jgi:nitroreductase
MNSKAIRLMENSNHIISSIIRNRKSTFTNNLKDNPRIEDSVISEILENAIWAPSHGLVQPWYFKVFTGEGVKRFYLAQQKIYKESTSPEKFNETKFNKFTDKINKVSHIVVIICQRDPKKRYPKQEDIVSTACVVENIYLCLDSYGIAGYLSTGDVCYTPQMREYLNLGEDDECIGFFILGLPDETSVSLNRKRIPAINKTEWIRE